MSDEESDETPQSYSDDYYAYLQLYERAAEGEFELEHCTPIEPFNPNDETFYFFDSVEEKLMCANENIVMAGTQAGIHNPRRTTYQGQPFYQLYDDVHVQVSDLERALDSDIETFWLLPLTFVEDEKVSGDSYFLYRCVYAPYTQRDKLAFLLYFYYLTSLDKTKLRILKYIIKMFYRDNVPAFHATHFSLSYFLQTASDMLVNGVVEDAFEGYASTVSEWIISQNMEEPLNILQFDIAVSQSVLVDLQHFLSVVFGLGFFPEIQSLYENPLRRLFRDRRALMEILEEEEVKSSIADDSLSFVPDSLLFTNMTFGFDVSTTLNVVNTRLFKPLVRAIIGTLKRRAIEDLSRDPFRRAYYRLRPSSAPRDPFLDILEDDPDHGFTVMTVQMGAPNRYRIYVWPAKLLLERLVRAREYFPREY